MEKCEYCGMGSPFIVDRYSDITIEIDDEGISVWQGYECLGACKANFCIECGRKLGEQNG